MKKNIISISDSNGYGKKRVEDAMKDGYKVSSSGTKVDNSGGYYTVYILIRKNWFERLFKL